MQFSQFREAPEPFSQRFRRFLRTQPVLAFMLAQGIIVYFSLSAGFFYGIHFILLLYLGGVFLRQFYNDFVLVGVYLAGGIAGYLTFALMFSAPLDQISDLHLAAIQGSAIFALITFIAAARSDLKLRVFLLMQIRFWHIALLAIIFTILRRDLADGGTHLSYLGGSIVAALGAWIFVRNMKGLPLSWIKKIIPKRKNTGYARYETIKESGRPLRDEEYNDIRASRQQKVDEILDKISRSGYDSLTKTEKELLFRQSK
jgi:hypothetical protein